MIKRAIRGASLYAMAFSLAALLSFWVLGSPVALWCVGVALIAAASYGLSHYLQTNVLVSAIDGHEGPCVPVWLNKNEVHYRDVGAITGFFRTAKKLPLLPLYVPTGDEFHGYVKNDRTVASTEGHFRGMLPL